MVALPAAGFARRSNTDRVTARRLAKAQKRAEHDLRRAMRAFLACR